MPDLTTMSVEELVKLEADLAVQRTAIRVQQNEVAAELGLRRALQSMPEGAREIVKLRLSGSIAPEGATAGVVE